MRGPSPRDQPGLLRSIRSSVSRARRSTLIVAGAYLSAATAGAVMAHSGNRFALSQGDALVSAAQSGAVLAQRTPILSALFDFVGNLWGGLVSSVLGLGIALPFPFILYRGWVGGIVSVDAKHFSRLAHPTPAAYYLSVLLLQLLAYSLAGGAGLHVGLANLRSPSARVRWLLGLPREALIDAVRLYMLTIPLFFIASTWEFLSPWR
jgi:hypothetical protein